jgi:hypothetical protein
MKKLIIFFLFVAISASAFSQMMPGMMGGKQADKIDDGKISGTVIDRQRNARILFKHRTLKRTYWSICRRKYWSI